MGIDEIIHLARIEDKKNINGKPTERFKELEAMVLRSDYEDVLKFAKENFKSTNKQAFSKEIVKSDDLDLNYDFAWHVKDIDVLPHQNVVMEQGYIDYWMEFAKHVKGADIKALQKLIVKQASTKALFELALINGADVKEIGKKFANENYFGEMLWEMPDNTTKKLPFDAWFFYYIFLRSLDELVDYEEVSEYNIRFINYAFAYWVNGADIKLHEDVLLNKATTKTLYNSFFARDIKGADIKAHENLVLNGNDMLASLIFARDVKGADIKAHEKKLFEADNGKSVEFIIKKMIEFNRINNIYEARKKDVEEFFVDEIESIAKQLDKHMNSKELNLMTKYIQQIICKDHDFSKALYSYYFAKEVKGANIKAHEQNILKLNDPYASYLFAKDIASADLKAHGKVIKNSGCKKLMRKYRLLVLKKMMSKFAKQKQNKAEEEMIK